jgi:hypothetical protein
VNVITHGPEQDIKQAVASFIASLFVYMRNLILESSKWHENPQGSDQHHAVYGISVTAVPIWRRSLTHNAGQSEYKFLILPEFQLSPVPFVLPLPRQNVGDDYGHNGSNGGYAGRNSNRIHRYLRDGIGHEQTFPQLFTAGYILPTIPNASSSCQHLLPMFTT